jgi:hypothetical protein
MTLFLSRSLLNVKREGKILWAPVGQRPIALGHHRFEWVYVTGFVEPASGRTVWNIANAVCKEMFELVLGDFAKSVGAGPTKRIVPHGVGLAAYARTSVMLSCPLLCTPIAPSAR